jgi:hypothetical protein
VVVVIESLLTEIREKKKNKAVYEFCLLYTCSIFKLRTG